MSVCAVEGKEFLGPNPGSIGRRDVIRVLTVKAGHPAHPVRYRHEWAPTRAYWLDEETFKARFAAYEAKS